VWGRSGEVIGYLYQGICGISKLVDKQFHVGGVRGREFMNNADGPTFLERELVGLGVDGYRQVRVRDRASGPVPIHTFREHLTCFPNVKSFTFFTLELVY